MISLENKNDIQKLLSAFDQYFGLRANPHILNTQHFPIKVHSVHIRKTFDHLDGTVLATAGSVSTSLTEATLGCLGEKLERYCLQGRLASSKLKKFPLAQVPDNISAMNFKDLQELQGLHDFQFHIPTNTMRPLNSHEELFWMPGKKINDDTEIWIPESTLVLKCSHKTSFQATSNGCALGATFERAAISAAMELIERNNFLTMWWRKEEPQFVDFKEDLKNLHPKIFSAFGPWLNKMHLLYYPGQLGIPTFFPFFKSENRLNHPAFAIAGATNLNPAKALNRAFCEIGGMLNHRLNDIHRHGFSNSEKLSNFDESFLTFEDHWQKYQHDHMAKNVYFAHDFESQMLKPKLRLKNILNQDTGSDLSNWNFVKSKFKAAGLDPIAIDQTTDDIRALGFTTIRIIEKTFIDLNPSHATRRWGKSKLMGGKIKSILDLNQFPHPYP